MLKEQIIHYYEQCESDYRLLWDLNHSHAMHAGYWDKNTKTLRDALRRENEILAEMAHIKPGEKVLDAGCGVGGSSIFLAKNYRCHVTGITLSKKQSETAKSKAEKENKSLQVSFEVQDYSATTFPNESFDVVWAIESICHAPCKEAFIKEAHRILKPKGRLIVADGFALYPEYKDKDSRLMQRWLQGWGVQSLAMPKQFESHLLKHHFKNISYNNITENIWPSAKRLYYYSLPAILLSKIAEMVSLRSKNQTENLHSARCQYLALKQNLWQYGIFYAEK